MGVLSIDHPDIEEFVAAKSDKKSLRNFNVSVSVPDQFVQTLAVDGDWQLVNPSTKSVAKKNKIQKVENRLWIGQSWKDHRSCSTFSG
jgi:ribonucleoside-diphosphate reductase alpha chain